MRDMIINALKTVSGVCRFLGYTTLADYVDGLLANTALLDFIIGIIDRWFNQSAEGQATALSSSYLTDEEKQFADANAIDLEKLLTIIQWVITIINALRPKVQSYCVGEETSSGPEHNG